MNNYTKVESNSKCFSMFIPPFALENMARAGIDQAKSTILQSNITRKERAKWPEKMGSMLLKAVPTKKAVSSCIVKRSIYDCQHSWDTPNQGPLLRKEEDGPCGDADADGVYDFMGNLLDYLSKKLNRISLDNNGMDLIGNVHYGEMYDNAFWDGTQIYFGDGDGVYFTSFAKSLDVIAHELGHGVVQHTANFEYHDQPGALNEHYADVFGTIVTQYAEKQTAKTADWLIGDEVMGPELYGEAIRCMSEPGTAYDNDILGKDPQPAHMKDFYTGTDDNGGVHINSGIMNKAFYLTAKEIGTDHAALIWYTALQKLWSTANFNDAYKQIVTASRLLEKTNAIKKASTQRVRTAFKQVGLPYKTCIQVDSK